MRLRSGRVIEGDRKNPEEIRVSRSNSIFWFLLLGIIACYNMETITNIYTITNVDGITNVNGILNNILKNISDIILVNISEIDVYPIFDFS
jgi:hypothetical protein